MTYDEAYRLICWAILLILGIPVAAMLWEPIIGILTGLCALLFGGRRP